MEKKISLHQKETMEINLYKEEISLKREALEVMRENARSTAESIKTMAESMCAIGQNMREGFAMISNSIVLSQQMGNAFHLPNLRRQQHFFGTLPKVSSLSTGSNPSFSGCSGL